MAEISTVQQLPAPFIEAAGKTFLEQLQTAVGGLKGADLSKVMGPQFVAPTSQISQEAQALRGGLGSLHLSYKQQRLHWANCISAVYVTISTGCY